MFKRIANFYKKLHIVVKYVMAYRERELRRSFTAKFPLLSACIPGPKLIRVKYREEKIPRPSCGPGWSSKEYIGTYSFTLMNKDHNLVIVMKDGYEIPCVAIRSIIELKEGEE